MAKQSAYGIWRKLSGEMAKYSWRMAWRRSGIGSGGEENGEANNMKAYRRRRRKPIESQKGEDALARRLNQSAAISQRKRKAWRRK